jgi:ubiquinone biosynthesis UbiH/UbiF/VisC/COQ6 family hydroxylase
MNYDIIIIGAGTSGLSFAKSLEKTNLKIAIIEKQPEDKLAAPPYDGREFAITHLSHKILNDLDMWHRIDPDAISLIKNAKVLNGDSDYALHFSHTESGEDNLGFMTSNHLIRKAAYESVKQSKNIEILSGVEVTDIHTDDTQATLTLSNGDTMTAQLVVAADSRFSKTREMMNIETEKLDFKRTCIVCKMDYEGDEQDTAMECFHYGRTLAVLPLTNKRCSVVITIDTDKAHEILDVTPEDLAGDIAQRIDGHLGVMKLTTELFSYPLMGIYAKKFYAKRYALLGDTAVGMHPVTAHGFNMGLRGAHTLAQEIKNAQAQGLDFSSPTVLDAYHQKHRRFTRPLYLGTNALVKLYTNESAPAKFLRHGLLKLGNRLKPAKHIITNLLTETDNNKAA